MLKTIKQGAQDSNSGDHAKMSAIFAIVKRKENHCPNFTKIHP